MMTSNGEELSDICIGTGELEKNYNDTFGSIIKKYNKFIDIGFNFFDTGSVYDNFRSIKILKEVYKSNRNKIFLNNKFHPKCSSKEDIIKDTENILKTLNIECLDMLQNHWPNSKLSDEDIISTFMKLKKDGKIRYFGFSNPYTKTLKNQNTLSQLDSLQVETNIYQNSLGLNFEKLVLGYSVFRYIKSSSFKNENITLLDHLKFIIEHGVTPIIRTLNVEKIKNLRELNKLNLNKNKIKVLKDLYAKKTIYLNLNDLNFPKHIKTYKNLKDAYENILKHNPSPREISNEIKSENIIKPIKVTRNNSKYSILDGIDRLWAHKINKTSQIECIVVDI